MVPLLPLIAEITDKDQPALFWYITGGVVAFIAVVNYVLSSAVSWQQLRTSGKGHECASRAELQVIHTRVDGITLSMAGEIGKMRGEVVGLIKEEREDSQKHRSYVIEELNGLNRTIGQVEGMKTTIEEHGDRLRDMERNRTQHKG